MRCGFFCVCVSVKTRSMAWYKEPSVSWFYVKEKQQCGPVQFDGLADLYEKGTRGGGVDDGTLLWSDRMSGWMKIKVCTSRELVD